MELSVNCQSYFIYFKLLTLKGYMFSLLTGDVFLLGSTNSGKSTLFNALLSSDYCKYHVRDVIHRATVSRWPGTNTVCW